MKYICILGLIVFLTTSCDDRRELTREERLEKLGVTIVKIDGCEYIGYRTYPGYIGYSHKGDCKSPIHKVER